MEIEISGDRFIEKLKIFLAISLLIVVPGINFAQMGAGWGDVVFNEIMYDPTPVVKIDSGEYVEFLNRSTTSLNMEDWILVSGTRKYILGPSILDPGEYLVLTGINLPNKGTQLSLFSEEGVLVHATEYKEPWSGEEWKKQGGWSLENPDPSIPCIAYKFWEFSSDRSGGTPGRRNSVSWSIGDSDDPVLLWYGLPEEGIVSLQYSEPVRLQSSLWKRITTYNGEDATDSIWPGDFLSTLLHCSIRTEIAGRRSYRLLVPGMSDCSGNEGREEQLEIGEPDSPEPGTLLINEIMFNPEEGAQEFIEIYQPGPGIVDLSDFCIAQAGEEGPEKLLPLSMVSRILGPEQYLLICRVQEALIAYYDLENGGNIAGLPELGSLPDTGGEIWLCDRSGSLVDRVIFSDEMHIDLLGISRGVSLERISPAANSMDPSSWHSAASIDGYATPGRRNSQYLPERTGKQDLCLEPRVFSPDQDGFEDLLRILPGSVEHGTILDLWISDLGGRLIRILANKHLMSPTSIYTWDGEDENGNMVAEGIFVVHARYFRPSDGKNWKQREAGAVVYP